MIIEDNQDSAEMLGMLLEFNGHVVYGANSGSAGLSLASKLDVDFVLTDLGLPDMNEIDVIRAL
ncbi:DNA-binding response OmpR family regulator [Massilia aurea]|uniref:DNA-binding response OmpR family regulator n=1 Tax=Massilia aurea TaxID=373040 RepID=A0A7W9WXB8_9BURK|nr:response regulator [Massilia aurea]MBB6132663.1 DNA-binding response OmpR family regulator [Massilia aurea]